jgi:hypothetical protein
MDWKRLATGAAEGAIAYGFYLLMTTPKSEQDLARAKAYLLLAHGTQKLAEMFGMIGVMLGRYGLETERKASACLS